jgi:hypothetical protein
MINDDNYDYVGVSVNHLDIAPAYASVVYGVGNTSAQLPGMLGVWFTGWLLDMTGNNWIAVFGLASAISCVGAIAWSIMCGTKPVIR